jgi:hypothetical protein
MHDDYQNHSIVREHIDNALALSSITPGSKTISCQLYQWRDEPFQKRWYVEVSYSVSTNAWSSIQVTEDSIIDLLARFDRELARHEELNTRRPYHMEENRKRRMGQVDIKLEDLELDFSNL